jgi:hypothetical protein
MESNALAIVAIGVGANYLVARKVCDFRPLAQYGLQVVTSRKLLSILRNPLSACRQFCPMFPGSE